MHPEPRRSERARLAAERLRSLQVSSPPPLEPRHFRNHFEHFDERFEDWATSSARRNFIDSNVSPDAIIGGLAPGDYLRNFDTGTHAVTFRGDTYPLRPIIDAVAALHDVASREADNRP